MNIEEKYKDIDQATRNFVISYGAELAELNDDYFSDISLMEAYIAIQPHEDEIRNDYKACRQTIDKVINRWHHSFFDLEEIYWFILGAFRVCEEFRIKDELKQRKKERETKRKQLVAKITKARAVIPKHTKRFQDYITVDNKKEYIQQLRNKIGDKRGVSVIRDIINPEMKNGNIMNSLSFPAFNTEFPNIIDKGGYSRTKYRVKKQIEKLK